MKGFIQPDDKVIVSASTLASHMPQKNMEVFTALYMMKYLALPTPDNMSNNLDRLMGLAERGYEFLAGETLLDNRFGIPNEDGLTPAQLGTHVHGVLEDILKQGTLHPRKVSENPYDTTKAHVAQIQDWVKTCKVSLNNGEAFVYNPVLGVGGTQDIDADLDIRLSKKRTRVKDVCVDLKTTAKKPKRFYSAKYGIQLGTYCSATHRWDMPYHPRMLVDPGRHYLINPKEHAASVPATKQHDISIILTVWPEGWQMKGINMTEVLPYVPVASEAYFYQREQLKARNRFVIPGVLGEGAA